MDGFRLISYCISHFFMMGFMMAFARRKYPPDRTLRILGIAFLLLSGLEIVQYFVDGCKQADSIIVVLQILVLQSVSIMVSDFHDFRALFTGLMASNYVLPGVLCGSYIYILTGWSVAAVVCEILLGVGILWLMVRLLRPMYLDIQGEGSGEWSAMCLMPVLFYVSAMGLDLAVRGSGKPLKAMMTVMFFLLIMFVSYYLVFHMIGRLYREQQAVKDRQILKAGIRALRHELDGLGDTERRIALHIRDRQQMVRVMREMMAEKDYDGMNQVLEQMQDMTEVRCPVRYTDSAPVNGVLVSYAAEAKKRGISFSVLMELPDKLRVNDWQLAVAIGNLLDNAIRACDEAGGGADRNVRVTARQKRGQVLIEIRNTCGADVDFDRETGLPLSRRGENHGIGLRSVAYFAEKNQIVFSCGVEQGEFFARMLI